MRLIDADALEPDADYYEGDYWAVSIVQIHNAPTIEPQRKRGKWINIREGNRADCNQCGQSGRAWMNFCFACGADMREGAERRTNG